MDIKSNIQIAKDKLSNGIRTTSVAKFEGASFFMRLNRKGEIEYSKDVVDSYTFIIYKNERGFIAGIKRELNK